MLDLKAGIFRLISCQVLNATPSAVEREAEIIAQAGMPRTSPAGEPCITIATSLAGRGTDIRLGGDAKGLMQMALRSLLLPFMLDFSLPQGILLLTAAELSLRCGGHGVVSVETCGEAYQLVGGNIL